MNRDTGTYVISTTLAEPVRAFVPHALPPTEPALAPAVYAELNRQAEPTASACCSRPRPALRATACLKCCR